MMFEDTNVDANSYQFQSAVRILLLTYTLTVERYSMNTKTTLVQQYLNRLLHQMVMSLLLVYQ